LGKLEGLTAVITGGGTGIGAAIALAMAAEKAHLHLIGRRIGLLEVVAAQVRAGGGEATCHLCDLASESGLADLARRLASDLRQVDVLVQNAAMFVSGAIADASLEDFDRHYHTNVRAPYALTQALLPMLKARRGQVVFINSSSGITAKPLTGQYDASKHALRAIADSLRSEVNADGVRVLSVYLSRTASEMQARIHEREGKPYRPELLLQAKDVAAIILNALALPRTAEVTDIHIRPMIKS
jgi:NADP-dependent 3-hydroxy acid dehydrogenase YdfG